MAQVAASSAYATEAEGQAEFFHEFGIDPDVALVLNTDGVWRGNLLEFKLSIPDVNQVLFQAVKYLAKLRLNGRPVPANILLIDLGAEKIYKFDSADYFDQIHRTYTSSASRQNRGFRAARAPEMVPDYYHGNGQRVRELLREQRYLPIEITADCVVAWAERFYNEVPGSDKAAFLNSDPKKGALGELRDPRHFAGQILPYRGPDYEAFSQILDRLNEKLKKIELGAFYTPELYVKKAHELLMESIGRVPAGNDYVVIDRCAGSGNLERGLDQVHCTNCRDDSPHSVLSHCIVNTYEQFEYLELAREFGDSVRAIIPPTYKEGDPHFGMLLNGDALSERFVRGVGTDAVCGSAGIIQRHLDDETCSVILFENPPYADSSGIEAQMEARREGTRDSFGWKGSWVKKQMQAEWKPARGEGNNIALRDLSNIFVWSAFRYYLRQPTDSYVVFSPPKYVTTQGVIDRRFVRGFLFNRKHFHAEVGSGISCVLWANEPAPAGQDSFPLEVFDIDTKTSRVGDTPVLVAGTADGGAPTAVSAAVATRRISALYDTRSVREYEVGVASEKNGYEATRKITVTPRYGDDLIGYLSAMGFSFENADLNTQLSRCAAYNVDGGFYLRRDNFLAKLPLFVVGRYPAATRWWQRGVVNRSADRWADVDAYTSEMEQDREFLKQCLIYTALSRHNKCLSFTGSDGRAYRNELCLDAGTEASQALALLAKEVGLTPAERDLLAQWETVLAEARKVTDPNRHGSSSPVFDPSVPWGLYQIDVELNTKYKQDLGAGRTKTVYDYPLLNGALRTLKTMTAAYLADVIAPRLWEYELLK